MIKPDYDGGSLLNLMASLGKALGLADTPYPLLSPALAANLEPLSGCSHIILLVIDGLGDHILTRHSPDGILARHRVASLTSVFPSTTASAIPTFLTGLPPQAHGLTGWHMWFEEIEQILAVLPLTPRGAPPGAWHPACTTLPGRLFSHRPLSRPLAERGWNVVPQDIIESSFNRFHTEGAQRIGYRGTAGLFAAIETAVAQAGKSGKPNFIHAYYATLDSLMHEVGTKDEKVTRRLARLEAELEASVKRLAGSGAVFVVTADHGFIDAPPDRLIDLDQHPELASLLARPLCGERRVAYAYVQHDKQLEFETYVKTHLGHACEVFTNQDFIAAGWFGPGLAHPLLASRIGDFVLVMKEDWTIKDWMPGEKHYSQLGVHGGASEDEMRIPLAVLST